MMDIDIKSLPQDSQEIIQEILMYVKGQLGYPIVKVELTDEVIAFFISQSLIELAKYNVVLVTESIPRSTHSSDSGGSSTFKIDTTKLTYKFSYLFSVYKAENTSNLMAGMQEIVGIPMGWKSQSTYSGSSSIVSALNSMYNERVLLSKQLNSMKDQLTYNYFEDTDTLWVDTGYSTSSITLEYVPILTLDNIGILRKRPEAYTILQSLVLSSSMIALGRARGKYATSNYDWALSSQELLEEGKSLRNQMTDLLNINYSWIMLD